MSSIYFYSHYQKIFQKYPETLPEESYKDVQEFLPYQPVMTAIKSDLLIFQYVKLIYAQSQENG
jgi:hypothetical protein